MGPRCRPTRAFQDFLSLNDSRLRAWGYIANADKPSFFAAAACVIVPVYMGGGAKLKTADALASRRPVITTPHALEGYGPLVQDVLGRGVYVADTPLAFRDLIRQALREGLIGCSAEVKQRVSLARLANTLSIQYHALIAAT